MRTNVDVFKKWVEVLLLLQEREYTLKEIEEKTGLAYKTVLKMMDDLEELGFIERTIDSSTPPRYIIKISKKGECIIKCLSK